MATAQAPETGASIGGVPAPIALRGVKQDDFALMEKFQTDLAEAMPTIRALLPPEGPTPEALAAMCMNAVAVNVDLLKCTPVSLVRSIIKLATLNLRLGDTADIVSTKDRRRNIEVAECRPRIKGIVELAHRARAIRWADAEVACEGDVFENEERDGGTHFYHKKLVDPKIDGSNVTYFYAKIDPPTGSRIYKVMTRKQVEAHRDKYAKGLDNPNSTWRTQFIAMGKKTVIGQGLSFSPRATALMRAVTAGDIGDGTFEVIGNGASDPLAALNAAAPALAALGAGASADGDGTVEDATDGLTLAEARAMLLPFKAEAFGNHGGKPLVECATILPALVEWIDKDEKRADKYARLDAAAIMVMQDIELASTNDDDV